MSRGRQRADLLINHASTLVTMSPSIPHTGSMMSQVAVIRDGAVAVSEGRITAVGKTTEVEASVEIGPSTTVLDANGKTVTPGLVDPHTHLVFGGWRADEFGCLLRGVPYKQLLAEGKGIQQTVRATREASFMALVEKAMPVLDWMVRWGVTTVEIKSGYGLELETELKQLNVIRQLMQMTTLDLIPTFLGAHAIPPEYKDRPDEYISFLVNVMLPLISERHLAEFVDVFCEPGVFTPSQSETLLKAAKDQGFGLKIHADEMESSGGAELAARLGATSADHLMAASDEGLDAMARAGVIAVILPGTSLVLRKPAANARRMIEKGLAVAIATDFNPGSCPVQTLPLVMSLACLLCGMTPEEALCAATINAAFACGRGNVVGSLEVGKQADIVIFNAPDLSYIPYRVGTNLAEVVIKKGKIVSRSQFKMGVIQGVG
ncbi:MAG TPA: imidazolonepropionase [Firmicutes bacterium]|nr:imidazolonepropionase [Bacillota bacterium]